MPTSQALQLVRHIDKVGTLYLRGTAGLHAAREAISLAMNAAGLKVTFDPESEPAIVDFLTVPVLTALDKALPWALLGAAIGAIAGRPAVGLSLGTGAGLIFGTVRGLELVHQGWRVRAVNAIDGSALLQLTAQ